MPQYRWLSCEMSYVAATCCQ